MLPWAMAFAAFVVGIPMFFEIGLVVLLPLMFRWPTPECPVFA
jgi:GntP family gluconate:H+ symporter